MFTKTIVVVFPVAFVFLLSCNDVGDLNLVDETTPSDEELIWVGKVFTGGEQCNQNKMDTLRQIRSSF